MMNRLLVLLFLSVSFSQVALAEIPDSISFQGRLTDTGGVLLNGTFNVTLRIYDAASGGNLIWTEVNSTVAVINGIHNIYLGNVTSLASLLFDRPYWISIEINSGGEMTPRRPMTTAPYAFRARFADRGDYRFPDGMDGTYKYLTITSASGYTVPAGKTLYILSWTPESSTSSIVIDGQSITGDTSMLGTVGLPIIVGAGKVITSTPSAFATYITGLEVPAGVTVKNFALGSGGTYLVPAGKTMWVFTIAPNRGSVVVRVNGMPAISMGRQYGFSTQFFSGIPVAGGATLDWVVSAGSPTSVYFTGYER